MLAERFMIWVDGIPTRGVSDSFEIAKNIALKSATGNNRVEIKTTNGLVRTWLYNNGTKQFEYVA